MLYILISFNKAEICAIIALPMLPFEVNQTSVTPLSTQMVLIVSHPRSLTLLSYCKVVIAKIMLNITKKNLKHIYDNTCIYADKINWHHMISCCFILRKLEVAAKQSRALSYPLSIHKQLVNNATSRSSSCTNNWHFRLLQKTVYKSGGTNYWKGKEMFNSQLYPVC